MSTIIYSCSELVCRRYFFHLSFCSVNRVEILGGVAETPVLRTARNGNSFSVFSVITNNKSAGGVETIDRHHITAFGKTAEYVTNNITKGCVCIFLMFALGTRVLVLGQLHYTGGNLQDDGTRTPRQTHIHANLVQPIAKSQAATKRDDQF